MSSKVLRRRDT